MRRVAVFALVAGGTAVAVTAGSRARARYRTWKAVAGTFPDGTAHARLGAGPKTLLFIPGGPAFGAPSRLWLALMPFMFRPLTQAGYTVWTVDRKRDMPRGHSIAEMADDYAALIASELGGKVDLVIGESLGGMIGLHLAARHPDRFGHIAIVSAGSIVANTSSDVEFARLLEAGRRDEACAAMVRGLFPDLKASGGDRVLGAVFARFLLGADRPGFGMDAMVEAEAEVGYDARDVLPSIPVPVLLISGDRDQYFPLEVIEETARLIPDCTLVLYEGKDHMGTGMDGRVYRDIIGWVGDRPSIGSKPDAAEVRRSVEEPVAVA